MLAEASFLLTVTMKQQTRVVPVRMRMEELQRNLKLTFALFCLPEKGECMNSKNKLAEMPIRPLLYTMVMPCVSGAESAKQPRNICGIIK